MAFENVRIKSTRNGANLLVGSREDAVAGDTIQLSLTDTTGVSSCRWEVVGRPEHSTVGGGSLPGVLGTGLTASFTVDADAGAVSLDGSYVIHAILNEGGPSARRLSMFVARPTGLTIPAPGGGTSLLRRLGAFESLEDTLSIPTILQGWATMLNRWLRWVWLNAGGGGAPEVVHPFYAVDYDGGNDANDGFSDVSMADAGTKAKKTWEGLLAILPKDGQAKVIDIGIKGRAAGATYLKQDGVTGAPFDFRPLSKYSAIRVWGTGDFTLNAEDIKRQSPIIAAGCTGPNGDGSFTITAVAGNVITIGGGGLPTDATARGFRLRVYNPGTPGTTKYVRGIKRINGNDITVMATSIAGVAINDVCVIETPGAACTQVLWWGGTYGPRADDGYNTLWADGQALILHGIRATGAGNLSSKFIGGDLYMEFCDFGYEIVTRVAYLESAPYNAGVGFRIPGFPALGADFIDCTACAAVGSGFAHWTAEEMDISDSITNRAIMVARGGDVQVGGSYLTRVRFTTNNVDSIRGGSWYIPNAERWNGGYFELTGEGATFFVSGLSGASGSAYPFLLTNLQHSIVDFNSVTLPTGYTQLAALPGLGIVLSQADWDVMADSSWGMEDIRGNQYNYAGGQVVHAYRVGGAAVAPFLACRMTTTAKRVVEALADSNANGRVRGVSMCHAEANQGLTLVEAGIVPLDMTDGLGTAYVINSPVYLSDVTAGKGTVTAPGIAILIGYIVANSSVNNRPYVDLDIKTQD